MNVIIHNNKYNDLIEFKIEKLTENEKQDILYQVHAKGWEDKDCWSEVEQ